MKAIKLAYLLSVLVLTSAPSQAQWEVSAAFGAAFPFTGYGAVTKTGSLLGIAAGKRFSDEKWRINFKIDWARMHKDKNSSDAFENVKMDIVPMTFNIERQLGHHHSLKPYVGAGLGVSLYNILYHSATTGDVAELNASFTMAPEVGLSLKTESNINPFIEARMVFVADGPPIRFPKSDNGTGYYGLSLGFKYVFRN
jgi:hypothetical protein